MQLRVPFAPYGLNFVQPISWYFTFLSYHITIYIYTYICIFLLTFLITHKVVQLLEFLVSNGNVAQSSHLFQNLRFLSQLLSGRYRNWNWVASAQRFKTLIRYSTKTVQTSQCINCKPQNKDV